MRVAILLITLIQVPAYADLDKDQQEGLRQTQEMLRNPSLRQDAINKDPKAKDMDNKVSALAGTKENKDDMYALAAAVLEKVAKEANGDPAKMQALMTEAQRDPKAFYEKFMTPDQQAKVSNIAGKISKEQPSLGNSK